MIFVIREHQLPCVVLQKHLCGDPEYHKRDMPEEGYPSCERVTQTKAPGDTYGLGARDAGLPWAIKCALLKRPFWGLRQQPGHLGAGSRSGSRR